jgi:hypothetical protein
MGDDYSVPHLKLSTIKVTVPLLHVPLQFSRRLTTVALAPAASAASAIVQCV